MGDTAQEQRRPLAAKMASAMAEVGGTVRNDAQNTQQGYGYTSAAAVLATAQRALATQGVACSTECTIVDSQWGQTKGGGSRQLVTLAMTLTLTDGHESMGVQSFGAGSDSGDKALFKAQTSALKYALSQALCIGLGDDPEADESTDREPAQYERAAKSQTNGQGNGGGGGMPLPKSGDRNQQVPFGKHKGEKLRDVPGDYMEFLIKKWGEELEAGQARDPGKARAWRDAFQTELHDREDAQGPDPEAELGNDQVPF